MPWTDENAQTLNGTPGCAAFTSCRNRTAAIRSTAKASAYSCSVPPSPFAVATGTTTSIVPWAACADATIARTPAGVETSPWSGATSFGVRAQAVTVAPSAANAPTTATPMPRLAPATSTCAPASPRSISVRACPASHVPRKQEAARRIDLEADDGPHRGRGSTRPLGLHRVGEARHVDAVGEPRAPKGDVCDGADELSVRARDDADDLRSQ